MRGAPRLISGRAATSAPAPLRPAHLVGRQHERVGAERGDVAVDPPGHLHRVAEDEAARGMDERRRLGDRLDDARLVVRALQRQQRASGTAGRRPRASRDRRVRPAASGAVSAAGNRCPDKTQACSPAETMSRSSGAAFRPAAEQRIERRVRGLGAAGHERDAAGADPRQPRDFAPRVLDDAPRRAALGVDRRGIAGRLHRGERGLARLRAQRRGRVIVEIGSVQCGLAAAIAAPVLALGTEEPLRDSAVFPCNCRAPSVL